MTDKYINTKYPEYRAERYDKDLRHNWRDIQNKVILADTKANRPTSDIPEKAWFFAEDERVFYQYLPNDTNADADGWVVQGGVGSSNTPIPEGHFSTLHTGEQSYTGPDGTAGVAWAQDLLLNSDGQYWEVKGLTDSEAGAKLQNALDATPENGWLYVPPRDYVQDLVFGTNEKMERAMFSFGRQNARVIGDTSHAIEIRAGNTYRSTITNMAFKTPSGGGNAADAVHISDAGNSNPVNFKLLNCQVTEADRDAYHFEDNVNGISVMDSHASTAGDVDRYAVRMGGTRNNIELLASDGSVRVESSAVRCSVKTTGVQNPVVEVGGGPYNMIDMGTSKGIDLTFLSGGGENVVRGMRFGSITNNGQSTNAAFQWFDGGGFQGVA